MRALTARGRGDARRRRAQAEAAAAARAKAEADCAGLRQGHRAELDAERAAAEAALQRARAAQARRPLCSPHRAAGRLFWGKELGSRTPGGAGGRG